jgi:hypothetical protein
MLTVVVKIVCSWEEIQNGSSRKGATACCVRRREGVNWIMWLGTGIIVGLL